MRVAVTGASGNVGTSVLAALGQEPSVDSVLGIARRRPRLELAKVGWATADVARDELEPLFRGADAVVHLAWQIQPSRDRARLRATNVDGSRRVFAAAVRAGVSSLLYASSVGAYSEGPKDRAVDEGWPTEGVPTSHYSADKAAVERALDEIEVANPDLRIVRMRPGLIFKRDAASEIRRYFAGPFAPPFLFSPAAIPAVPDLERLRFQAVHTDDVAEAYRLALTSDTRGAFNVAADPVLDPPRLAELLGARRVGIAAAPLRGLVSASWRARLQPTPAGWLDMALAVPVMSSQRARSELGWLPRKSSEEALLELLAGMRAGAGYPTPPLDPAASGPLRINELRTGVGARGL